MKSILISVTILQDSILYSGVGRTEQDAGEWPEVGVFNAINLPQPLAIAGLLAQTDH